MNKPRMDMDHLQICLAKDISILPNVYSNFLTNLKEMEYKSQVSLLPVAIFQVFHQRLKKAS